MIVYKGEKRIFDKIFEESNTSTANTRILTILGVSAYSELNGVILDILSYITGSNNTTLNINNLGAVPIKKMDKNGTLIPVKDNWVLAGQVYSVLYTNGSFMILNESVNKVEALNINSGILNLASTSTVQDIENVLGNTGDFINNLLEDKLLIMSNPGNIKTIVNYIINYDGNDDIYSVILEFIHNGFYYKQTYSVDTSTGLITEVDVKTLDLLDPTHGGGAN